jgi:hypothetical protein
MYVHYGCHFKAPQEWRNFDASWTLRWERLPLIGRTYTKNSMRFPPNVQVGDIVAGLPVPAASCQGVYASHVLEHLCREDFHRALDNTRNILREGGIFRLVVPDLEWAASEYIRNLRAGNYEANAVFLQATLLGREKRVRGIRDLVYSWLRTSAHLWMWDGPSLAQALRDHGFRNVRQCQFGDCEDSMFALVEEEGRFEHAAAVEARR